jgi:flagellar secretion chaperone FliS
MNPQNAASAYQEATFDNAPPIKIVHMMYEGALRFLGQAEQIDPLSRPAEFNEMVNRAEAIVAELRLAVRPEHSPELAEKLDSLYHFVETALREAILDRKVGVLGDAKSVLKILLDGWKKVGADLREAG